MCWAVAGKATRYRYGQASCRCADRSAIRTEHSRTQVHPRSAGFGIISVEKRLTSQRDRSILLPCSVQFLFINTSIVGGCFRAARALNQTVQALVSSSRSGSARYAYNVTSNLGCRSNRMLFGPHNYFLVRIMSDVWMFRY